jgi:hypothetical protein
MALYRPFQVGEMRLGGVRVSNRIACSLLFSLFRKLCAPRFLFPQKYFFLHGHS